MANECLDEHWFLSLRQAGHVIAGWRQEYNRERSHSSLGYLAPRTTRNWLQCLYWVICGWLANELLRPSDPCMRRKKNASTAAWRKARADLLGETVRASGFIGRFFTVNIRNGGGYAVTPWAFFLASPTGRALECYGIILGFCPLSFATLMLFKLTQSRLPRVCIRYRDKQGF
jgi:hypothetical protein